MEMTLNIKGSFNIGLEDMTQGFLKDITIDIFNLDFLVSNGGASSGMAKGIYIHMKRGLNNVGDVFKGIIDQVKGIFSAFGVVIPTPPNLNVDANVGVGLFIQEDSLGIHLNARLFELKCAYIYASNKGSCEFNHQGFTALLNAGKWLIRNASRFLDDTGKEIMQFAQETGKFAANASRAAQQTLADGKNFFTRDVKNAFSTSINTTKNWFRNEVGSGINNQCHIVHGHITSTIDAAGNIANAAGTIITNVAQDVGRDISNTYHVAVGTISNTADTVGSGIVQGATTVGNAIESGANTAGNAIEGGINTVGNAITSGTWIKNKSKK